MRREGWKPWIAPSLSHMHKEYEVAMGRWIRAAAITVRLENWEKLRNRAEGGLDDGEKREGGIEDGSVDHCR